MRTRRPESATVHSLSLDAAGALYALGCFERRVTIYAQQVRALELAHALVAGGGVRPTGAVAIVGGGISGVTLAAALAAAAPGVRVVLHEAADRLMHLQRGARDRFVHPHIFDWPAGGTNAPDAGLPLMNWHAGPASDVVAGLEREFEAMRIGSRMEVRLNSKVDGIVPVGDAFRLTLGGSEVGDLYDAAVLCIGFGLERHLSAQSPSYWSPSLLSAPLLTGKPSVTVFVSGNGDGGLADFALAAFNGLAHGEILGLVTGCEGSADLGELLLALDEQAWREDSFDLLSAYREQVAPVLPKHLLRDVFDRLRPGTKVMLHTVGRHLFRPDTSLMNRLVVFLAILADDFYGRHALQTLTGCRIDGPPEGEPVIRLEGGQVVRADLRLLRFGPDLETVRRPFEAIMRRPDGGAVGEASHRPATPALSAETRQWYRDRLGQRPHPARAEEQPRPGHEQGPAADGRINVIGGSVGAGASVVQIYTGSPSRRGGDS